VFVATRSSAWHAVPVSDDSWVDGGTYERSWVAPGDPAAVESVLNNILEALGGRRTEVHGDVLFDGVIVFHMRAHVVPNAQHHPAMTAHYSLGPGWSQISTRVKLRLVAEHARDVGKPRFTNRCLEIVTSVVQATGSVPEPS
jgi:hypothetical protein